MTEHLIKDDSEGNPLKSNKAAYDMIASLRDDERFIVFLQLVELDRLVAIQGKNEAIDAGTGTAMIQRGVEIGLDGVLDKIDNLQRLSEGEEQPDELTY